jgi:hypothetical protein
MSGSGRKAALVWAIVAYAVVVLPQLFKAYHIDDTLFLLQAEQILRTPLGPYSFAVNWSSASQPALMKTFNPPLLGYYLAGIIAIFGEAEWVAHLFTGVFVSLATYWSYLLAARLTCRPLPATALVIFSPAFLPALNCMPDIPSVALGLGGLFYVLRGCDEYRWRDALVGAFILGLAVWMKYPAVWFVALAGIFALVRRPWFLVSLTIPAAMVALLAVWQIGTHGETHFFVSQRIKVFGLFDQLGLNLRLIGFSLPALPLILLGQRDFRPGAVALGIMGAAAAYGWMKLSSSVEVARFFYSSPAFFVSLFALGSICLGAAFVALIAGRDFIDRWLGLWAVGALLFTSYYPEFPALRRLTLLLFPLALVTVRQLYDGRHAQALKRRSRDLVVSMFVLAQCMIAFWVAAADHEWANVYRAFVTRNQVAWNNRVVWTLGHIGWQWYANRAGWHTWASGESRPNAGDLFVSPRFIIKQLVYLKESKPGSLEIVGVQEGAIEPRRYGVVRPLTSEEHPSRLKIILHTDWWPRITSSTPLEVFDVYEFVSAD